MTVAEVAAPRREAVTVKGEQAWLEPLTIRQTIRLGKLAQELAAPIVARLQSSPGAQDNAVALMSMLEVLAETPGKLGQVLAVILKQDDRPGRHEALDDLALEDISDIARAFAKVNNLAKLAENFSEAMEAIKRAMMPSPLPSAK